MAPEEPTTVQPAAPVPPAPAGPQRSPHEPSYGGGPGEPPPPLPPTGGDDRGDGNGGDDGNRDRNLLLGALAIALVVIAILGAILLTGDDGDDATVPAPAVTTPAQTTPAETTPQPTTPEDDDAATPDDDAATPDDDAATPAPGDDQSSSGGVAPGAVIPLLTPATVTTVTARQGDTIRFRVRADIDDELHVHGYDKRIDVAAGVEQRVEFPATIAGVFDIELHNAGVTIGELTVEP